MPTLGGDTQRRLRRLGGGGFFCKMLVLMLVAAATLRLCLLARAQPLCRWGCPPRGGVLPGVAEGAGASLSRGSPTSLRAPSFLF